MRGGPQHALAHAVGALRFPAESALADPVLFAELSVRVDRLRKLLGHLLELIGAQFGGLVGQELLGGLLHVERSLGGDLSEEGHDLGEVRGVEQTTVPGLRGGGQVRCQRFTGQGAALADQCGLREPCGGFGGGDPQGVGDQLLRDVAQGGKGFVGDGGADRGADRQGQAPVGFHGVHRLETIAHRHRGPIGAVHDVETGGDHRQPLAEFSRIHVRNATPHPRRESDVIHSRELSPDHPNDWRTTEEKAYKLPRPAADQSRR